ncbi:MAG: LpxD N-terminal domain-containing protein, partial [Candidatus Nanoarchaeia archaeon]
MKEHKLYEIAEIVGGKIRGNGEILISGVAGLLEATSHEISFLSNKKYVSKLSSSKAGAVIVSEEQQSE